MLTVFILDIPPIKGGVSSATSEEKYALCRYLLNLMFDATIGALDLEQAMIDLSDAWACDRTGEFIHSQVKDLRLNQIVKITEEVVYVMYAEMNYHITTELHFISDKLMKMSVFGDYTNIDQIDDTGLGCLKLE